MISKNDLILLLTDLEEKGINIDNKISELFNSNTQTPIQILKFINDNRKLDLTLFYQKLRKSYNSKKSKLYLQIVKEGLDPIEIITTLASYQLQAILYSKKVEDSQMFLRHSRAKEVSLALAKYFNNYDPSLCINLLKLIRTDLIACETIDGHRK